MNGVKQDESNAWSVDESVGRLISDGSDGRLDIDVPIEEKDDAKALGAKWDPELKCWHISASDYQGGITRWSPKTTSRTHPSIGDALRMARRSEEHTSELQSLMSISYAVFCLKKKNKKTKKKKQHNKHTKPNKLHT